MNHQDQQDLHHYVATTKRNRVTFSLFPPATTTTTTTPTTTTITEDEERQQKQHQQHQHELLPQVFDEEEAQPQRPSSPPSLLPSSPPSSLKKSSTRHFPTKRISLFATQESAGSSSIDGDMTIDSSTTTSSNIGSPIFPRNNYRRISSSSSSSSNSDNSDNSDNSNNSNNRNSGGSSGESTGVISAGGGGSSHANNGRGWRTLRKLLEDGELALKVSEVTRTRKHKRHDSIRQQVFEDFHSGMNFSVSTCLISILGYLCVSILLFTYLLEPSWSIIDSCYFAVTTFTTLGYGDLAPSSPISRFFTCIYALLGVMTLGFALGALGNRIIERHQHAKCQRENFSKFQIMSMFDTNSTSPIVVKNGCSDELLQMSTPPTTSSSNNHSSSSSAACRRTSNSSVLRAHIYDKNVISKTRSAALVVVVLILTILIGYDAGWKIMDAFYFLIVTGCTIGYGDITPTTEKGRLFAIIYIPLACLMTGHALTYIAQSMTDKKENRFLCEYKAKELTQDDIDAMDTDGDGAVKWAEFLEFMLVAMHKVDYELIDELQAHFQKLDVDGTGELDRSDLAEMARRKLLDPRRKLEMANYKQYLLKQAAKARKQRRRRSFFGWLPHMFRKHDRIGIGRGHDIEKGDDFQSSMQKAANEVAAMVENQTLDAPGLGRCESADYPYSPTKERYSTRLSLPAGAHDYGTLSF